jgi:cyclic pyranopterin phosphate synthase
MRDELDRPLRDLRISVTDRCNLRCRYCMPSEVYGAGHVFLPRAELLSFEEIARIVRVLAAQGVDKLRLTGGEPLLRRDLARLVAMLSAIDGIDDIALTTNGLLLAGKAQALADAGLSRVTVSLDALDDDTLHAISGAPISAARVLDGIDAATAAGLSPVKVNMVVRRGLNEDCVLAIADHFRDRPQVLRFIEYMDVGSTNGWSREDVVPAAEILAQLEARWPLEKLAPARAGEVATVTTCARCFGPARAISTLPSGRA